MRVALEHTPHVLEQRLVLRMTGLGRPRGGHQPSDEPGVIKYLLVGKGGELHGAAEELTHGGDIRAAADHLIVFRRVGARQPLEVLKEGAALARVLVPQQCAVATGSQQPQRLAPGALDLEPVERLARHQQINAAGCERRVLGRAPNAVKARRTREQHLGGAAHAIVRLDPEHLRPACQEQLRQNAGA